MGILGGLYTTQSIPLCLDQAALKSSVSLVINVDYSPTSSLRKPQFDVVVWEKFYHYSSSWLGEGLSFLPLVSLAVEYVVVQSMFVSLWVEALHT